MSKPSNSPPLGELPFLSHLIELRDRLLKVVLAVVVIFLSIFYFANDLYTFLAEPLMRHLPEGASMIATEVASPFLTPFKLALVASVFIAVPFILYQVWAFIAPGLYKSEQRLVYPLILSSTILFYAGMAFAYYIVFPLVFGFLTSVAPEGVTVATDIGKYLDFVLKMFFAFGVAFEVPIATILLVWSDMTTVESLKQKRPYIIVGAFVVGMLLTPPDVISQTLLAVPMWLLFEVGLLFARFYVKKESATTEEEHSIAPAAVAVAESGVSPPSNDGEPEHYYEHQRQAHGEYEPLTPEQMDAELDRIEAEERRDVPATDSGAQGGDSDQARGESGKEDGAAKTTGRDR